MLRVENVGLVRGGIALVSGLSFDMAAGHCVILRGRNGAGKTTLLRAIAGLGDIQAGTITVDEDPAFGAHADGLKASLTVKENLEFWAQMYGQSDIDTAVQTWELAQLLDRNAAAMSAGQKRRVGLARLMVTGRKLWVLDEPTTALDKGFTARFEDAVRGHLAAGGAALLSTHTELDLTASTVNLDDYKPNLSQDDDDDTWAGVL